jgi:hypothetical protein
MASAAKGPKFWLNNSIRAAMKFEGPEKLAADFEPDLQKQEAKKGAALFAMVWT